MKYKEYKTVKSFEGKTLLSCHLPFYSEEAAIYSFTPPGKVSKRQLSAIGSWARRIHSPAISELPGRVEGDRPTGFLIVPICSLMMAGGDLISHSNAIPAWPSVKGMGS